MNLSERITFAMDQGPAAPLSQADLHRKTGLSRAAISLAIKGDTKSLKAENAVALAAALGVRFQWLVKGEEPMEIQPPAVTGTGSFGQAPQSTSGKVIVLTQPVAPRVVPDENVGNVTAVPMSTRMLPVLTYVQAGEPLNDHIDDFAPGAADEYVPVDAIMARKLGPYAFALYVEGDSMEPLFRQGDLVIIDPDTAVRSGDYVVAKVGGKSRATLKKYVDRGVDAQGREQFDLVPLNTNGHHTLRINAGNPGSIIGVVVQKITSFR